MKKWINPFFAIPAIVLIVVLIVLSLSLYIVRPGQAALLLHGDKVAATVDTPGLHWRTPLRDGVVVLNTKLQLDTGQIGNGSESSPDALAVNYVVAWRIVAPERFYTATGGDAGVARTRLDGTIGKTLGAAIQSGKDATAFLERPAATLEAALRTAAAPIAKPLGVEVLGVYLGATKLPATLSQKIGRQMAAATQEQIGAAESVGKTNAADIESNAALERIEIIATANRQAARIRGEGEAKIVAIYAKAAREQPEFFSFYHALQTERDQLMSNTKVLVISVDSPWFKALGPGTGTGAAGGGN
ncbi:MAG: SPFH domain-containing protein [Gammaproteobacteria bacterium]